MRRLTVVAPDGGTRRLVLRTFTVLDDGGLEARVPLPARQLVAIHAVRPGNTRNQAPWSVVRRGRPLLGSRLAVLLTSAANVMESAPLRGPIGPVMP
jgi:hypothetical protein